MYHNRTNKNKITRLHEGYFRLIYNAKKSSFEDLFERCKSISIHQRNSRTLARILEHAVELFKVLKSLSLVTFAEAFPVSQQS